MLCDDCLHADICENITQGNCDWYLSAIRWTDKVFVKSNGDIIDFEGRVVGRINLESMKGESTSKPNCVTCDHFGKCEGCEKRDEE